MCLNSFARNLLSASACESALAITTNSERSLPKERGSVCLKSEVA